MTRKKSSLRASSPFGGYREKYTRERHATGDAIVGGPFVGPSRLRRSLARSLAQRACSQAIKNPLTFMVEFNFNRVLRSDGNLKIKTFTK